MGGGWGGGSFNISLGSGQEKLENNFFFPHSYPFSAGTRWLF